MNNIEDPLIITCIGNTFKLNKRLIAEDEESFEFVDKQVAIDLQLEINNLKKQLGNEN